MDLDEEIKKSELLKNQEEYNRIKAETEKIAAEKKKIEADIESTKLTFWLKPIVTGIFAGIAFLGLYESVFKKIHYIDVTNEQKKNIDLGLTNSKNERDLYRLTIAFEKETKKFHDSIAVVNRNAKFLSDQISKSQKQFDMLQDSIKEIMKKKSSTSKVYKLLKKSKIINPPNKDKSILWVDDNPNNNTLYKNYLNQQGIKVDQVSSTILAKNKISNNYYSAIISDMSRIENNKLNSYAGNDLLSYIEKNNVKTPILFYTSSGTQDQQLKNSYDKKGILMTNLFENVSNFLKNNKIIENP